MSPHYNTEYASRHRRGRSSKRRRTKQFSTLLLVLGVLCVIISVAVFSWSCFRNTNAAQHRLEAFSGVYLVIGAGLLGGRRLIAVLQARQSDRPHHRVLDGMAPTATPPAPSAPDARDGQVLIMVLVILALVAVWVLEIQMSARATLRHEATRLLRAGLHQAAADATRQALRRLADDEDLACDHAGERWAGTKEIRTPAGIGVRVSVTDANRRFDLNNLSVPAGPAAGRAPADVVLDILTLCGDFAPVERVEALRDWMDPDDQGATDTPYYAKLKPPYRAANAPLESWGDLPHVRHFSRGYFAPHERHASSEPYSANPVDSLDVLPGTRTRPVPVNVNTAGREVLLGVLGIESESLAQWILSARAASPLRSSDSILGSLDPERAAAIEPLLDVRSSFFTVDTRAYAQGRSERLHVLARRGSRGDVEVLQWVF